MCSSQHLCLYGRGTYLSHLSPWRTGGSLSSYEPPSARDCRLPGDGSGGHPCRGVNNVRLSEEKRTAGAVCRGYRPCPHRTRPAQGPWEQRRLRGTDSAQLTPTAWRSLRRARVSMWRIPSRDILSSSASSLRLWTLPSRSP